MKTKTKTIAKRFDLLAIGGDPKTRKGQKDGWLTAILYLVPAGLYGTKNLCAWAGICKHVCLFKQGRGKMSNVIKGRLRKTKLFEEDETRFVDTIKSEIGKAIAWTEKQGYKLAVRLNGTSDVAWEKYDIHKTYPKTPFYDYSKGSHRIDKYLSGRLEENYHLTFSRDERNGKEAKRLAKAGANVAAVFRSELPETWQGQDVINGDKNDLRFLDRKGSVVGLLAKGSAKNDNLGFVLN
jgi:hypothetical protein